ncbi:MAG: ATP-binding cassette domain-containing protein [Bacteroidia bacterium]
MQIQLSNVGKRYNYEWIFRYINQEFISENNYVILGANGSGKSTLLQIIAGSTTTSEGSITYNKDDQKKNSISEDTVYTQLSFAAPYLELFEEFTLFESIVFHAKFKPFFVGLDTAEIINLLEFKKAKNKQLKYFSSGMKQRVRLAFAILSNTPLLLLDEPTSNLDKVAIDWYQNLINIYSANRLIIVASNQQEHEYFICNKQINIEDYK